MKKKLWLGALLLVSCRPPSVQAVDTWLSAYAQGDDEAMLAVSWPRDRSTLKDALSALRTVPTSTLALALPPQPLAYEIVEIESKVSQDRHIVLTKIKTKNPLPFVSEKVGQALKGIPKMRARRRRLLVVREEGRWGVKLDLERVLARARFVSAFEALLAKRAWDKAEALFSSVPPPPDEANALQKKDRLVETLRAKLQRKSEPEPFNKRLKPD